MRAYKGKNYQTKLHNVNIVSNTSYRNITAEKRGFDFGWTLHREPRPKCKRLL